MRRRIIVGLALLASLVLASTPALAATDTFHYVNYGRGMFAAWDDIEWSEEGPLPGTYFQLMVDALEYVEATADTTGGEVCVWYESFILAEDGDGEVIESFGGCGSADAFAVDKKLAAGHVEATIPIEECLVWDEETGECLESETIGTVSLDVTAVGVGRIERSQSKYSGGLPGSYHYSSHGKSLYRSAEVDGSVTLDGTSLTEGALWTGGSLFWSRDGYLEVIHDPIYE